MDYVDALPLLDAALRDLQGTAHLVRDERYPMLELMSAIEINDPRTDTFLHARQQLPASGEFDPALHLEYSDSEVLDISNHLLQLEVSSRSFPFPSHAHAETTPLCRQRFKPVTRSRQPSGPATSSAPRPSRPCPRPRPEPTPSCVPSSSAL